MSQEITTAFVSQFSANVTMLTQQRGSVLRGTVDEEPMNAKEDYFDRVGATTASPRTVRHGDVVYANTPHDRRRLTTMSYEWADLVDRQDKIRTLIDPTNSYAQTAAYAMGRAMDDVIIAAVRGSAWSGEKGATEVPLPSDQKVGIQFGTSPAANIGYTLPKMRETKRIFDAADVPPDMPRVMVISAYQLYEMLGIEEVTSADYNNIQALVNGQVNTFLGFQFKTLNRLIKASGIRYCLAYIKSGVKLGIGENPTTKIDPIPTKGYSTQVYLSMDIGATRMEEVQVVEIACAEA